MLSNYIYLVFFTNTDDAIRVIKSRLMTYLEPSAWYQSVPPFNSSSVTANVYKCKSSNIFSQSFTILELGFDSLFSIGSYAMVNILMDIYRINFIDGLQFDPSYFYRQIQ